MEYNSFGELLKSRSEELGISQRDLATRLKVSERTIQGYMNNIYKPIMPQSSNFVKDLSKILDVKYEELERLLTQKDE